MLTTATLAAAAAAAAAAAWAGVTPAAVAQAPAAIPTPVPSGSVRVAVTIADPRGATQPAVDAVVWLPGVRHAGDAGEPRAAASIAQRRKAFEPHVQVVSAGSSVAFPNFDRFYHNVFSLSEIAPFDLGLYRNGASRSLAFSRPGVLRIYCNIHPDMAAFLVVVDSDVFGKTGANGIVELRGVPAGDWSVRAWHEKGGELEGRVAVVPSRMSAVSLKLDASRWRASAHKNKYGKDYPPPDDDENRY